MTRGRAVALRASPEVPVREPLGLESISCALPIRDDPVEFFDRLVRDHYSVVYRFLYRVTGHDRPLAEDLCQEAFMRAFRVTARLRFDRLAAGSDAVQESETDDVAQKPRAWLLRIGMNAYLNERRRKRPVSIDAVAEPVAPGNPTLPMADHVRAFIQSLPPKQRAATILRVVEGREYDEIANVLECTQTAARANVSEALRKIRARFQGERQKK